MLLALDTSTSYASFALVDGGRALLELNWEVGRNHSSELLTWLDDLLTRRGLALEQLDAIAVATGPGSFNGVRVGVATAKSLAFALGIRLSGHPTLDVIAWGARAMWVPGPIWAILEAGRGQVYAGAYAAPDPAADAAISRSPTNWAPQDGYSICTPEELAARICEPVVFCGEWRPETRAALEQALGERARFVQTTGTRRASWLADLALARLAAGDGDAPEVLEPLYLRRPSITSGAQPARRLTPEPDAQEKTPGGEGASRAISS